MSIILTIIQIFMVLATIGVPIILIVLIIRSIRDHLDLKREQNEILDNIHHELEKLNNK